MTEQPLQGRHAVVTGAAQGIGRATAVLLARRGATVTGIDVESAEDAADGGQVRVPVRALDLTGSPEVETFAQELERGTPEVDILVNCAAAYPSGGLLHSEAADWSRVLAVNVTAAARLTQAVARRLIERGEPGAVVNVGAVQQVIPLPDHGPYIASKGAVTAMTRTWALELGASGIRVNEVVPGTVHSASFTRKLAEGGQAAVPTGSQHHDSGDTRRESADIAPTLLRRAGTPEEVAEVIAFLASDAASFVTGASVPVDGGRRLSRLPDPQVPQPESDR